MMAQKFWEAQKMVTLSNSILLHIQQKVIFVTAAFKRTKTLYAIQNKIQITPSQEVITG